jgi:hypothetical protein
MVPFDPADGVMVKVLIVKLAVTFLSAVMLTMQVPVPVQPSPDQPVKVELTSDEAVRVTEVP